MRLPVSKQVLLNLLPITNFKTISIVILVTNAIVKTFFCMILMEGSCMSVSLPDYLK